jgi:hypothetical protein
MMDTIPLGDTLHDLVVQHGLVTVLRALASIMADTGNVTGGMVSEIAAIEEWLVAEHNPGLRQN